MEQVFSTIDIPICPAIVTNVMREAQRDEPNIRALCSAIEKDVGMSAMTIKLANSPLFRTSDPVSRVSIALARLGILNVVSVVVAAALRNCMPGLDARWLENFWNHASKTATVAGLVARKQHGIAPDAAFTFAMFHDSAIPLLRKRFENFSEVMAAARSSDRLLIDAEEEYFPCTHPIVGSLLARNWGLPPLIAKAIRFHHEPDVYHLSEQILPSAALSLIAVTHVAEVLLADRDAPNLEVTQDHYQSALHHLGIAQEELEEIYERVMEECDHH